MQVIEKTLALDTTDTALEQERQLRDVELLWIGGGQNDISNG